MVIGFFSFFFFRPVSGPVIYEVVFCRPSVHGTLTGLECSDHLRSFYGYTRSIVKPESLGRRRRIYRKVGGDDLVKHIRMLKDLRW